VRGMPISATPNQWTWVPFDDAFCANGTSTGIGINPSSGGSRVLIYMEGGGACWSAETCYTLMTASYVTTGYSEAEFDVEKSDATYLALPGGFFDRTAAANPFKDYSYVYLPYCTGDVFAGDNVTKLGTVTTHFVGHANVAAFLSRLVPTFSAVERVVLAGSSAGGYGAVYNWWQTQAAFGSIGVDMLDDSGTFLPADVIADGAGYQTMQASAWNLTATSPPCSDCLGNPSAIYGFYAKAFPNNRGALLSYLDDAVLPTFYGITTTQFAMGLDEDLSDEFAPNPNLKAFVLNAAGHVLFFSPLATQNGVTVQTFVTQMVTDSSSWETVSP
jgi:Pectinacetylesterase